MAMSGDVLGLAIGNAFYNAIPADVISNMTAAAQTGATTSTGTGTIT